MLARGLYKELLRYGQALKYTDKQFFYRRIRSEFENNRVLTDGEKVTFQLERGKYFLKNRLLI